MRVALAASSMRDSIASNRVDGTMRALASRYLDGEPLGGDPPEGGARRRSERSPLASRTIIV